MTDWTYTFCDMRTKVELATLPLTKVKFNRGVRAVGRLDAYLSLSDPKVRALNPWAATRQRRVECYVEYGDRCLWGGPVMVRNRSAGSQGLSLTGITFEGWLARQRLLTDLHLVGGTRDLVTGLIAAAQTTTSIGLTVEAGPAGTARDDTYLAREVKPLFSIIEDLMTSTDVGGEWLIDCYRDTDGTFKRVVRLAEPRLGRRYEDVPLTLSYPDGGLTDWTFTEDGSGADNVLPFLGSGSGETQPFDVLLDAQAGIDEIASGFPTWMRDFRNSDTADLDYIRAKAVTAMRAGLAGEAIFSGIKFHGPEFFTTGAVPADDIALEIAHVAFPEFPDPVTYVTRMLGMDVTVGDAGAQDVVALTAGGTS